MKAILCTVLLILVAAILSTTTAQTVPPTPPVRYCEFSSQCNADRQCIMVNGVGTCLNPCRNGGPCAAGGANGAICTVMRHELSCMCPPGTSGDPLVMCIRIPIPG